ncbi:hypothetical protein NC653_031175 [Populus alba x Populus x berolinensis]|uniref:Uncharacterized protein n=1 Tax=Populus alba x Populus x berolinensis TaxID=444605 RepID=A0AAD6LYW8_9ROSI|nr:hypothetical protein NC653_031175 [Populus alba x Populus x berolinensis]
MDFHSLSRKDLQALCKKNKIPANMTNISMADALKVLDKVEGLDEFTNAPPKSDSQQSPEKAGSNEILQTSCRTSTRKKPLRIEPESSQKPLTRTPCTTRRRVIGGDGDQENKNANHPETPAMPASRNRISSTSARRKMETKMIEIAEDQQKNNVPKTPAANSCRRMAPAVSARRKVEAQKEEVSVQRVYSTRQSLRLLERSMGGMSLKEKGSVGPLKMDDLCKEIDDVVMKEEYSGSDLLTVPEKSSEKTFDTEAVSCQNLGHSLEDKREIKHEPQEESNTDVCEVEECNAKQEIGSENCDNSKVILLDNESEMTNELEEDNKNNDCDMDHCKPKLEGMNESSEKSNPILVERSDKAVPINQEPIYEKGTVKSGFMVSDSPTLEVSEFVDKNSEMISKEDKQHHDNDDLQSNFAIEGESDSNQSDEANENGEVEIVPEDASNQKSESRHEAESCHSVTGSSSTSKFPDHFVTSNLVAPFKDISFKCENEALVEIHVMEAEEIDMKTHEWHASSCVSNETPGYVNQTNTLASDNDSGKILLHKVHDHSSAENLVDITVMSQEEFAMAPFPALDKTPSSPCQPLVAGAITVQTGLSPFADDTLQGQFPRPTELVPKKSSTKKQPTSWQMIDAINKENIDDDGGKKMEPRKEKENNKVIGEKILDEFSLRQLRKMMKEKLQIANNKNSEEDNDTKVGKTRLALQTLADENRRHGAEELK